jgi:hypothetical protein
MTTTLVAPAYRRRAATIRHRRRNLILGWICISLSRRGAGLRQWWYPAGNSLAVLV